MSLENAVFHVVRHTTELPNLIEETRPIEEFPHHLEETGKILEPDIVEIRELSLDAIEQINIERAKAKVNEGAKGLKELTEEEKQKLREENNLPENILKAIKVDKDGNYKVKCINERYKDMENPDTGVRYIEKTIPVNEVKITVTAPEFSSIFEVEVPPEMWQRRSYNINKYCTEKLRLYLNEHSELKANFTPKQLSEIERGKAKIPELTWHHYEIPGKMQLVDSETHKNTRHTGGNFLWCSSIR